MTTIYKQSKKTHQEKGMTPNQYRCETCKRDGCYFHPGMADARGLDIDHPTTIPVFICRFGCASHSDFQNQKELWCGDCGFKESETCNDEITWKRCRLMSSEPEGVNVENRLELARNSAIEKVLDELKRDLKTRFVPSSNQWSKGRNSGLIECCNIIDEFRQAGEP